eukprot:TRINITY_DN1476_c0_g1_i3.p1 TRINITY_DN1476_c0_g1~~TRINITY_DN1476_c0_g1_i3.p1  ORF type:complete len:433 (-),score=54.69 TRINITY_DN1476_c0_g1_i3:75-1373(-)
MKTIILATILGAQSWKSKEHTETVATNLTNCVDLGTTCSVNYTHTSALNRMVKSAAECCDATCALWTCGKGWKGSVSYHDNIGKSNEKCCDKTCSLVSCPSGQGTIPSLANEPGLEASYCCADLCSQHACYGSWTTDPSKAKVVNNTNEACCQPSCQSVTCDSSAGLVLDVSKADTAGTTSNFCCLKTCKYMSLNSECPTGFGIKPSVAANLSMTLPTGVSSSNKTCCSPKCSSITCPKGKIAVRAFANDFADAVECCQSTCSTYTCPHGWVSVVANDDNAQGASPAEACCERTCALFNCRSESGSGWFNSTDTNKLTSTIQSYKSCCDTSCVNYTCPAKHVIRPHPETRPSTATSTSCCEPEICPELRDNRTSMADDTNCNMKNQSECGKAFWTFVSEAGVKTFVPCIFRATPLNLCRLDDTNITTNCSGL